MDEPIPLVPRKSRRNSVKRNVKTDALVWSGGKNRATVMSVRIPPKRPRIRTLKTPVIPLTCSLRATVEKDLPLPERFYWSIDYSSHYKRWGNPMVLLFKWNLRVSPWFWNLGNFSSWNPEPWALESGIKFKESRILLTIGMWNPTCTDKQSAIHSVEFRIQDCSEWPCTGRNLIGRTFARCYLFKFLGFMKSFFFD